MNKKLYRFCFLPWKSCTFAPRKIWQCTGKCFHICWSFCHFRSSTSPCPEGSFLAPEISRLLGDTVGASLVVARKRMGSALKSLVERCFFRPTPLWLSPGRSQVCTCGNELWEVCKAVAWEGCKRERVRTFTKSIQLSKCSKQKTNKNKKWSLWFKRDLAASSAQGYLFFRPTPSWLSPGRSTGSSLQQANCAETH